VLWDCITYLDGETIDRIHEMGGLSAIVISHPHYYSTHLEWAETFDCPVYLSWEDKEWLNRLDRLGKARTFIEGTEEEIEVRGEKTGVKVLKLGGHFPGSLVCLAFRRLLVADTLVTTPSGMGNVSINVSLPNNISRAAWYLNLLGTCSRLLNLLGPINLKV
jgi:glyoxylase-like metal-dependent hydrolase (beta-lactamase superfamily II)